MSRADEALKIGASFPTTGALAVYGVALQRGALMAEKEINDAAAVSSSQPLKVVLSDNQGDPKTAVTDVKRLVDVDHVSALLHAFDFLTMPVLPVTEAKKVVMISATILPFTEATRPSFAFRAFWDAREIGRKFGAVMTARGIKKVGVIAAQDLSYSFFREGVAESYKGEIAAEERFAIGFTEVGQLLLRITAKRPDGWLVYAFPADVANIIKKLKSLGIDSMPLFITEGVEPEVIQNNHDILHKSAALTASGARLTSAHQAFIDRYSALYGEEPRLDALITYEMTKLLYAALRSCSSGDSACVAAKVGVEFDPNHNRVYDTPLLIYQDGWQELASSSDR